MEKILDDIKMVCAKLNPVLGDDLLSILFDIAISKTESDFPFLARMHIVDGKCIELEKFNSFPEEEVKKGLKTFLASFMYFLSKFTTETKLKAYSRR